MSDLESLTDQKLDELRAKAREKFSDEEINNMIKMGKILASKAVLSMLISVIKEGPSKGLSQEECDLLVKKITTRMPVSYSGYVSISFAEYPGYTLNITLSLVDHNYKTVCDLPSEHYVKELYQNYNLLKDTASAYWQQFCEENNPLFKRICDYLADYDMSTLKIDPLNPTTMFFDKEQDKKIGLFTYYLKDGKPIYKKGGKK